MRAAIDCESRPLNAQRDKLHRHIIWKVDDCRLHPKCIPLVLWVAVDESGSGLPLEESEPLFFQAFNRLVKYGALRVCFRGAEFRRANQVLIRSFLQHQIPEINGLNRSWTETEFQDAPSAHGRGENRIYQSDEGEEEESRFQDLPKHAFSASVHDANRP